MYILSFINIYPSYKLHGVKFLSRGALLDKVVDLRRVGLGLWTMNFEFEHLVLASVTCSFVIKNRLHFVLKFLIRGLYCRIFY